MIVCSCNVLTDGDVKACLREASDCPRTPAQLYRCLGCSPNCGSCARTIRGIMNEALAAAQAELCGGCASCPNHAPHRTHALDTPVRAPA